MSPNSSPTEEPSTDAKRPRGRTIALIAGGVVVLALVAAGLVAAGVRGASENSANSTSHSTPTAVPYAPPVTGPTTTPAPGSSAPSSAAPKVDPHFGLPVAKTAKQGTAVDFGAGVTAKIVSVTPTNVTAQGPGEVSGPAVQVDVQVTNSTSAAMSLDSISVNGYYGSAKTPATPLPSASDGFRGNLAAGASTQAKYSFSVPKADQGSFIVTMGSGASPIVVFTS